MSEATSKCFVRRWIKMPSMKALHETFGVYSGSWSRQMDRYWESNDGYTVSSRLIRTAIGQVEHVAISRLTPEKGDIPWAVKQEIKNELFGANAIAIEVFPAKKHLVDVCDVYHLWVLPKNSTMPFGIHPTRDPECQAIDRGYDVDLQKCQEWNDSDERKVLCRGPMWWKGLSEKAMSRFEAIRQGLTEAIAYEKGIAMLEEKNADLRYVIELTEDQARVTARACELYARLLNGQLDEINHELLLHENHNNICERRDQAMDLLLKLKQIYFPELHGHGHSYGVGHDEVSDRAWLVYQALRYCIAWHDHPEGGHGVDFYRPMAFGGGPVPKCEAKE